LEVFIHTASQTIVCQIQKPITISDLLRQQGLDAALPCNGHGLCGKCKVQATGTLSAPGDSEMRHLTPEERAAGIRLSCQATIQGNAHIYYNTKSTHIQGLTSGLMPDFLKNPLTGEQQCYGAAVDIGTTTIAAYLYHLPECTLCGTASAANPQAQYGADVISRIEYAEGGGLEALQMAVQSCVSKLLSQLHSDISVCVITGNTTMLHLWHGLDPSGIARAPFTPKSLFGSWDGKYYFPRCISSYVGADITTAILASDMMRHNRAFLVDIGTNGEMAYYRDGALSCCSTAAGPALEGVGISSGMLAAPGAIQHVRIEDGKLVCSVIGDGAATGICGSGLIDAIACLLKLEVIDESGYMEEPFELGDSGIFITPKDVRQVQLAKAAIRAGIETLVSNCSEIEVFYIAGGFGSYLDADSCETIGLIPPGMKDRIQVIGNAAGNGAAMILQSKDCLAQADAIAKSASVIELSESAVFMEHYTNSMFFDMES